MTDRPSTADTTEQLIASTPAALVAHGNPGRRDLGRGAAGTLSDPVITGSVAASAMSLQTDAPLVFVDPAPRIEAGASTFAAWVDTRGWGTIYELRLKPRADFQVEVLKTRGSSRLALRFRVWNLTPGRPHCYELLAANRHGVASTGRKRLPDMNDSLPRVVRDGLPAQSASRGESTFDVSRQHALQRSGQ